MEKHCPDVLQGLSLACSRRNAGEMWLDWFHNLAAWVKALALAHVAAAKRLSHNIARTDNKTQID